MGLDVFFEEILVQLFSCAGGNSSYDGEQIEFGTSRNNLSRLTLDNGHEVWDLSGNLLEWVNWERSNTLIGVIPENKAYVSSDGSPQSSFREFIDIDVNIGISDEMFPDSWQAMDSFLTSSEGIGRYYGGSNSFGGAALRGGSSEGAEDVGIYYLDLNQESSYTNGHLIGFRCVHRP